MKESPSAESHGNPIRRKKSIIPLTVFEKARNKCVQQAVLALAASAHSHVHDSLQRMFRSSFANDAPTGAGRDKKSLEHVYATEKFLFDILAPTSSSSKVTEEILYAEMSYCIAGSLVVREALTWVS